MHPKSIYIVGAGQIGSRHLQALKVVELPLDITVIDPSKASLKTAKERYEEISGAPNHRIQFLNEIPSAFNPIDIAIIPTNSNVRRQVVQSLAERGRVRNFILEKLLFDRRADYFEIANLLKAKDIKAWVNCSMRTMPFYAGLRPIFESAQFRYMVTGSQYGLITNAIHFIDHIAYLSGELEYGVDTSLLCFPPIESKRRGFLELNGTLSVHFRNGCTGIFTCFPEGDTPVMIEIVSPEARVISKEWEKTALVSLRENRWKWNDVHSTVRYQSQMTTDVVKTLLMGRTCDLTPYNESMQLHLILLEGLRDYLNIHSKEIFNHYPFT